jgi:FkbM family methyltransferase
LANELSTPARPLIVLDIGANVGDSALQILNRVDARIVCVEGDPHWWSFLDRNVGTEARIFIERSMITSDGQMQLTPVRSYGTTRFVPGTTTHEVRHISGIELREKYPQLHRLHLIKSDTDGYDTRIVPELARVWADSRPALFFEYDPSLSRLAGHDDPTVVFDRLAELGYADAVVWDNGGRVLGSFALGDLAAESLRLNGERPFERLGYHYWDVAAVHGSDNAGRAALARLAG